MKITFNETKITQPKQTQLNQSVKPRSFRGIDSAIVATMDAIERGGLFASFTIQDMLGTNIPRPVAGLMRNKKENGNQVNKDFAIKEGIREFTTGPSMFIIPGALLAGTKKFIGKALDVPVRFIQPLGEKFETTLGQTGIKDAGFHKQYYTNVFNDVLSNSTNLEGTALKDKSSEFAGKLIEIGNYSKKQKKLKKVEIGKLVDSFTSLKKSSAIDSTEDFLSTALSVKDGKKALRFDKLLDYMGDYSHDAIKSTTKNADKGMEYVKNFKFKRAGGRFAFNIIAAGVMMSFVALIPKLYNRTKDDPGLRGLKPVAMDTQATGPKVNEQNPEKKAGG